MSGPRSCPRIPPAQSSSPNLRTLSARTPGPATMNGTGSPEWITSGVAGVAWSPVTQTIARSRPRRPRSTASSDSMTARFTSGSFVCPAASVAFWWTKTKLSPARNRASTSSSRAFRSPGASLDSGAATVSSPIVCASPRRNADSPMNVPCRPCRSRNVGTGFGLPHHFNVITLNTGRPAPARRVLISCSASSSIVQRVHSSAARAVRSASAVIASGRSTGWRSRKNASVSVTPSSAPPSMRRTASPRHSCASVKNNPSTSSPSHASTSACASAASRSASGRPVSHRPSSRRSAGRSAAYANTCAADTSCPRPTASKTARPGNSSGR